MRTHNHPVIRLTTTLLALTTLSACGSTPNSTPTITTTATAAATNNNTSPAPSTTTPTNTTPTIDPTTVARMTGGNGTSLKYMLGESFLPVGWNVTIPRDSGGYRMNICGVDIEPHPPVDTTAKRWQQTPTGPWIEQHIRTYEGNTATNIITALKTRITDCQRYTATDTNGGSSTYTVSGLTLRSADPDTVTWRQQLVPPPPATTTPTSPAATPSPSNSPTPHQLTQDVAMTKIGNTTVMLISYAVDQTPSVPLLDAAVSYLKKRH
ncbi:Uncharacterised protein [Dermatophilus congolensis]|uniref:PknH-like extracellular domain-containing protein n=2 Tax=Dermatophilus congolensis TaxID=1863 RepID=A0A239VD73_9MICO|nr:hypothetical protein [Dermatophilus congolensis]SNV19618.1 Uncharacterised protein [Dermatophilus congolensis]